MSRTQHEPVATRQLRTRILAIEGHGHLCQRALLTVRGADAARGGLVLELVPGLLTIGLYNQRQYAP